MFEYAWLPIGCRYCSITRFFVCSCRLLLIYCFIRAGIRSITFQFLFGKITVLQRALLPFYTWNFLERGQSAFRA